MFNSFLDPVVLSLMSNRARLPDIILAADGKNEMARTLLLLEIKSRIVKRRTKPVHRQRHNQNFFVELSQKQTSLTAILLPACEPAVFVRLRAGCANGMVCDKF